MNNQGQGQSQGQGQGYYDPRSPLAPGTIYGRFNPPGYGAGQHPAGYPPNYTTNTREPSSNVYPGNPANTRPYTGGGREGYGDIARGQGYPGYGTQYRGNNGEYPGDFKDTMEKPWAPKEWGPPPGGWPQGR